MKPMPFMAMVSSVGSNDEKDMYDYLGGVKNDKRSEELDAAFKQEKSNFSIVIVVDMWITGFDVPCLTYLYNDKPLKKHLLIQTISLSLIHIYILFNCRDYLRAARNSGSFFEKRDMMLTLERV